MRIMDQLKKDKRWFIDNYDSLRKQYPNSRYLAILHGEVLEHASDIISFDRKVDKIRDLNFLVVDFENSGDLTNEPQITGFSWMFEV